MKQFFTCLLIVWGLWTHTLPLQAQQPQTYSKRPEFLKANTHWPYGVSGGLDFSGGTPTPFSSAIPWDGAAAASDPQTGALLFYTDGLQVWDASHTVMPNGDSLYGGQNLQDVCIVPFVNDPHKYYIFMLLGFQAAQAQSSGRFHYCVVDMRLRDGKGDVVGGTKNVALQNEAADTASTGIIAIPGDNCDIWLMTHSFGKSEFKAYHIDEHGLDPNPVISVAGNLNTGAISAGWYVTGSYYRCAMTVSPDRRFITATSMDLIAAATGFSTPELNGTLIARFDPATGKVYDALEIENDLIAIKTAFSPDQSKLYLYNLNTNTFTFEVNQYNVSNFDSLAIATSKKVIADTIMGLAGYFQLYRDKIYFRTAAYDIHSIQQPDSSGTACDFRPGDTLTNDVMSLCSELVYAYPKDTVAKLKMDTLVCAVPEGGLHLSATSLTGFIYQWSTGSIDTTVTVTEAGTYWVSYNDSCHFKADTFVIRGMTVEIPIISINVRELSTSPGFKTYQWYRNNTKIPGAIYNTYTVKENGSYHVEVTNEAGCITESEAYDINNIVSIDPINALAAAITLYPNPAAERVYINAPATVGYTLLTIEGKVLSHSAASDQVSLANLTPGIYLLHITDGKGAYIKTEKIVKAGTP